MLREWMILSATRLLRSWQEKTVDLNAKEYAERGELVLLEFRRWRLWGSGDSHWDPSSSGCHVYNSELEYDGLETYQILHSPKDIKVWSESTSHQTNYHTRTWSWEPAWSLSSQPSLAFGIASVEEMMRFRNITFPFMLNSTFPLKCLRLVTLNGWY